MRLSWILAAVMTVAFADAFSADQPVSKWAVGPQYDSTHVYVAAEDLDRFVASFIGTFGGTASKKATVTVTPTPSQTAFQFVLSPVGTLSVFAFNTAVPYPFGAERTGYLVVDLDGAVHAAQLAGADVIVQPFPDAIGRDAVVQWPGGINMQLYWHKSAPSYQDLQSIPENRVYLPAHRASQFISGFVRFSGGKVVLDDKRAPGADIGRPGETYRLVRIESLFGKLSVIVTDGHLPYPYGRELTGYDVADLVGTLDKARANGATILVAPYPERDRHAAMVQFPGGYIAEVHALGGQ
jgi:hypothetical protein